MRIGCARDHVERSIDEVEERRVGPLEVLEDEDRRRPLRDALEEAPPGREELVPVERSVRARCEEGGEARLDPAPLDLVGHQLVERPSQLPGGELDLGALADPGPPPDHLGDRREGDPLAIRRRAADVQGEDLGQGVEIALEFPDEAALADPRDSEHRHDPAPAGGDRALEQVDELGELGAAPDEWAGVARPPPLRALGGHLHGEPGRHRSALAAEGHRAGRREHDPIAHDPPRGVVDEYSARRRGSLQPSRRVDEVAGDEALAVDARGDGDLAGADRGASAQRLVGGCPAEPDDRGHELESGTDRTLPVVLVSGLRAPDGHDGIADELLEHPAVVGHHGTGGLEIASLQVADILRVERLRERREVLEVDEQHRDEAALGREPLLRSRPGERRVRAAGMRHGPAAGVAERQARRDVRAAARTAGREARPA